jgi:ribonuclease E
MILAEVPRNADLPSKVDEDAVGNKTPSIAKDAVSVDVDDDDAGKVEDDDEDDDVDDVDDDEADEEEDEEVDADLSVTAL